MDQFVELLHEINIVQIFVIFAGIWVFYNRLDKKIEKVNSDLTGKIEKLNNDLSGKIEKVNDDLTGKIEKVNNDLSGKIDRIDTRLTRLENDMIEIKTILRFKECCMISDERQSKKAE
jgi:glycine cleavage system H lipoate-binding protein